MSRYIARAHNAFVEAVQTAAPSAVMPPSSIRLNGARTSIGSGVQRSRTQAGVRALAYNSHERRHLNLVEAVDRCERNLHEARRSPSFGEASRGFITQLSRRLHTARQELATFKAAPA